MIDLDYTFFVQLLNFLIILTVLNLVLYRPIRGIIKKRAEVMNEKLYSIEEFTSEAESKLENYQAALSGARFEAQQVRMTLKEEGVSAESAALAQAATKAAEKIALARQDIDSQKKTALKSLHGAVSGYAKDVATKVLHKG